MKSVEKAEVRIDQRRFATAPSRLRWLVLTVVAAAHFTLIVDLQFRRAGERFERMDKRIDKGGIIWFAPVSTPHPPQPSEQSALTSDTETSTHSGEVRMRKFGRRPYISSETLPGDSRPSKAPDSVDRGAVQSDDGVHPKPQLKLDLGRRTMREIAGSKTFAEKAAELMPELGPRTEQQQLAQNIERAAYGDCLKGEFAGGGIGLLSLPFLILAEARNHCARGSVLRAR